MKTPPFSIFHLILISLFVIGCASSEQHFSDSPEAGSPNPELVSGESLKDYRERLDWFAHAQYGMFIHFGLYSQLGGEWKGVPAWVYAEWIQAGLDIPSEEYVKLIHEFNPTGFDADKIVRSAKEAGMAYLVITAKHHEGFCLWDSAYTDFDVASSPFAGRDILAELKAACDKYGIKFGLYYSIIDWNHPTQKPERGSRDERFVWKHIELVEGREQAYFDYQTNQVLELIENYDPAIMWFDGDWADWWTLEEGVKLYNAIREADPDIVVNNRVAKRDTFEADYVTQEQNHFEDVFPKYWEACYTLNESWGYKKHDHEWKDAETIYNKLKDINEKGGSLLLNVGPDGNGVIQDEAYTILAETAELLKANPVRKTIPEINEVPGVVEDSARVTWRFLVEKRLRDNPAFVYVENDSALPNVLLYGDSISIGYTPEVRRRLKAEANVYRIHKNGQHSGAVIPWLQDMHTAMQDPLLDAPWTFNWDVIHFNVGLHDLTYRIPKDINDRHGERKRDKINGQLQTSIEDYKANLESIIAYFRAFAPEAKLVFALTTPVPEGDPGRIAGDAARYNAAAMEVLARHPEIQINDLHSVIQANHSDYWSKPGNVHYNEKGYTTLGRQVARSIQALLREISSK